MSTKNLGGRRAEAARNDHQVLTAAREAFIESGHETSMADIADRAQVGIGTLYRRYPSKIDLMRVVCSEAMTRSRDEAQAALNEEPDGWSALSRFVTTSAEQGTGALNRLSGTFEITDEMVQLSRSQRIAVDRIVDWAHREGTLRRDISAPDLMALSSALSARPPGVGALQQPRRYAQLMLDGMRSENTSSLPGTTPSWENFERAWRRNT